jgi:hypothetical protein
VTGVQKTEHPPFGLNRYGRRGEPGKTNGRAGLGTFGILECQMGGDTVFARFAALGHDLTKGRHERFLGNGKGTGFMKVHRHPHRTIKRLRKFFQQGGVSQNGCVRSFH